MGFVRVEETKAGRLCVPRGRVHPVVAVVWVRLGGRARDTRADGRQARARFSEARTRPKRSRVQEQPCNCTSIQEKCVNARKNTQVLRPYDDEESRAYRAVSAATAAAAAAAAAAASNVGRLGSLTSRGRGPSSTVTTAAAAAASVPRCRFVFFAPELVSVTRLPPPPPHPHLTPPRADLVPYPWLACAGWLVHARLVGVSAAALLHCCTVRCCTAAGW